uniref:Uncharacterized protein n=1 Tax=Varanus komodoensis TaxID=61221 RepID=A0A8D2KZ73_VARKO
MLADFCGQFLLLPRGRKKKEAGTEETEKLPPLSVPWLQRFDKSSRLVLSALMSGHWGALAAFRILQRSPSGEDARQGFNWQIFTENLCSQEPVLKGSEKILTM